MLVQALYCFVLSMPIIWTCLCFMSHQLWEGGACVSWIFSECVHFKWRADNTLNIYICVWFILFLALISWRSVSGAFVFHSQRRWFLLRPSSSSKQKPLIFSLYNMCVFFHFVARPNQFQIGRYDLFRWRQNFSTNIFLTFKECS